MNKLRPYPAYRPVSASWVSKLPDTWDFLPIRRLAKLESGHTPSRAHPEYWENCAIPWFTLADIWQVRKGGAKFVSETKEKVSALGLANSSARLLPRGTVLLSRTASVGFPCIADVDMATSQDFACWICGPRLNNEYLYYCLLAQRQEIERLTMGSTHKTVYMPDVMSLRTPVPSVSEQMAIVRFIESATRPIDRLIDRKTRFIELLKEKRQALISHVVTKGLNPTVDLTDSRMPWTGHAPSHWRPMKIKLLYRQVKRQGFPSLTVLSVYRDYGVIEKESRDDNNNKTPLDLSLYQLVNPGDLVINKMKAWQGSLGVSTLAGITSPDYIVYEPVSEQHPRFMHYLLRQQGMTSFYRSISNGIRPQQWRLEPAVFEASTVYLPPLAEQKAIAEYLDKEMSRLDKLVDVTARSVELLNERRSALITAAVTGKIDVRGQVDADTIEQAGFTNGAENTNERRRTAATRD